MTNSIINTGHCFPSVASLSDFLTFPPSFGQLLPIQSSPIQSETGISPREYRKASMRHFICGGRWVLPPTKTRELDNSPNTGEWPIFSHLLDQCLSNLNVRINHLELLLKCTFQLSRAGIRVLKSYWCLKRKEKSVIPCPFGSPGKCLTCLNSLHPGPAWVCGHQPRLPHSRWMLVLLSTAHTLALRRLQDHFV